MSLRFDGRVAIVTGSGGGLGRLYALELAKRGCKVVVNDLGSARDGDGNNSSAADQVVAEIREAGGEATPNYDSVEHAQKIVDTAINTYGRVDILINNAGFLRDVSFLKMTDRHWNGIMDIHLRAAFLMVQACWPHMKQQNYGRIINTTSGSGIYGNFGQTNYSAAKSGLIGFSNVLALEGAKTDLYTNSIAPTAASRLTEDIFPPDVQEIMAAKFIVPVVTYLVHESCTENGALLEIAGGYIAKLRIERAKGSYFSGEFGPEQIKESWNDIQDFDGKTQFPNATDDSFFVRVFEAASEKQEAKL